MKYSFKGKSLEITPSLKTFIRQKFEPLSKILQKEDAFLEVEVERETRHHKTGPVFLSRAVLDLKAKTPLVAKAESYDARSAIDIVKDILMTEVRKFRERRKTSILEGARKAKQMMREI